MQSRSTKFKKEGTIKLINDVYPSQLAHRSSSVSCNICYDLDMNIFEAQCGQVVHFAKSEFT